MTRTQKSVTAVTTAAVVAGGIWWFASSDGEQPLVTWGKSPPEVRLVPLTEPPDPEKVMAVVPNVMEITGLAVFPFSVGIQWTLGTASQVQLQGSSNLIQWVDVGLPTTNLTATDIRFDRQYYRLLAVTPPASGWPRQFGGTGTDYGLAVKLDAEGNNIVSGVFQGSVGFGGLLLTSAGGSDVFLAKYNAQADHLWSKRFGGGGDERVLVMSVAPDGTIYLAGSLYGTGNLGGTNMTSAGDSDIFLAKYSATGEHVWSLRAGGSQGDFVKGIASEGSSVVIVGHFQGGNFSNPIDFTGNGSGTVANGKAIYSSFGGMDSFIARYDGDGICQWAKNFPGNGATDAATGVVLDGSGNTIASGYFQGYVNFGGGQRDSSSAYFVKHNAGGGYVWDRVWGTLNYGGNPANKPARFHQMASDSTGSLLVCGDFVTQTDLGGGPIFGATAANMFVARYDANGNHVWSHSIPAQVGSYLFSQTGIAVGPQDELVLAGYFIGPYTFGNVTLTTSNSPYSDAFLAKYSSTGDFISAQQFGHGTGSTTANGLAVQSDGASILTGSFSGTANIGGQSMTSAGEVDGFVTKL